MESTRERERTKATKPVTGDEKLLVFDHPLFSSLFLVKIDMRSPGNPQEDSRSSANAPTSSGRNPWLVLWALQRSVLSKPTSFSLLFYYVFDSTLRFPRSIAREIWTVDNSSNAPRTDQLQPVDHSWFGSRMRAAYEYRMLVDNAGVHYHMDETPCETSLKIVRKKCKIITIK